MTDEDDVDWVVIPAIPLTTQTYTIDFGTQPSIYEVSVRAICRAGKSIVPVEWIAPITVSPSGVNCEELICGVPQDLQLSAVGENSIYIDWQASMEGTVVYYNIRYRNLADSNNDWEEIISGIETNYLLSGLLEGDYEIQLKSTCQERTTSEWTSGQLIDILPPSTDGGNSTEDDITDTDGDEEDDGIDIRGGDDDTDNEVPYSPIPENPYENPLTSPDFPSYDCNDPFSLPPLQGSGSLATAAAGDFFYNGGFHIQLTTVNGANGSFTGEGLVALPFGEIVEVKFTNIHANNLGEVTSGTVEGIRDVNSDIPDINNLPAVELGGEICRPPEEVLAAFDENGIWLPTGLPYNPQGFDVNGQYALNPDDPPYTVDNNYDPNGFDASGNHVVTGTQFNETGCNQTGLDENEQPCDEDGTSPYYWLPENQNTPNGAPTTTEGIAFAASVEDDIRPLVVQILADLHQEYTDNETTQRPICIDFRATMEDLLVALGYSEDRVFIFGPDDRYFAEGMHQNFSSRPTPLGINVQRNPAQKDLELRHIDLYDCDVLLYTYINMLTVIGMQQEDASIDDMVTDLLAIIQTFTQEQVDMYEGDENSEAFKTWLEEQISEVLQEIYDGL